MKAMVYDNYGSPDVLELREIENPTPKDDEVLIKVHAASVNAMDYRFLTGTPYLARAPLDPEDVSYEPIEQTPSAEPGNVQSPR